MKLFHVLFMGVALLCGPLWMEHRWLRGICMVSVQGSNLPKASHLDHHVCAKQATFLRDKYKVKDEDVEFSVRQVPGDGGCLFHAISACLSFVQTRKHAAFDWRMRKLSQLLRYLAVDTLQSSNTTLVIENGETTAATSLLKTIADVYSIYPGEYCAQILDPRTWGGGPEIVALSNHFKCPIHVYQLCTDKNVFAPFKKVKFQLQMCAKFGSPTFDSKAPLCILCADGRFPSITPGKQKPVGDHFLALFPASSVPDAVSNPPALSTVSSVGAIASTSLIPGAHSYDVCKSSGARSAVATVSFVGDQVRKMFSFMRPYAGLRRSACTKRTQSNECLMSDCPAMSSEATFLEWFS